MNLRRRGGGGSSFIVLCLCSETRGRLCRPADHDWHRTHIESGTADPVSLRHFLSNILTSGWRWQRFAVLLQSLNPLLDDLAQFGVDLGLVVAVTTWRDNSGTLTYKTLVFI
jgi:hypothetical protein